MKTQKRMWMVQDTLGYPVIHGDGGDCWQYAIYPTHREAKIMARKFTTDDNMPCRVVEITWKLKKLAILYFTYRFTCSAR